MKRPQIMMLMLWLRYRSRQGTRHPADLNSRLVVTWCYGRSGNQLCVSLRFDWHARPLAWEQTLDVICNTIYAIL
jgi:hypothetical protein